METRSLDVVIVGAGIGGLATALALQRAGHRVRLVERTRALRPVGAAISIWPNGVKVLRALGVGHELDLAAGTMNTMTYRDRDGHLMTRFSLRPLYQSVDERAKPVARMKLQRLLLDAVGASHVTLGLACRSYEQDAHGVTVHLSDGTTQRADLLVVSDGSRSQLRDRVAGIAVERRYRGYVNWNGRIPITRELAEPDEWTQFVGDNQRVSIMPMGQGEFYFFFDVPLADPAVVGIDATDTPILPTDSDAAPLSADNPERHRDVLGHYFAGWAPQVRRLLDRLDPALIAAVAIHDTDPLQRFVDGRVVMVGDAAHAMAPDLGQGGCQAIEDAWVLARALDDEAGHDVVAALRNFEIERLPRVHDVVARARKRAAVIHGEDAAQTQAWYDELREETGEGIIAGLRKTAESGPFG